jgi:hypothetical protein
MRDIKPIISKLEDFAKTLKKYEGNPDYARLTYDERKFILMLGGLSSFRKTPGIEPQPGFDAFGGLYVCPDEQSRQAVKNHLNQLYNVTDENSLWKVCEGFFWANSQYRHFLYYWNGVPLFDTAELNPYAKEAFFERMGFAEQFRPLVGNKGFLAWDVNERVNMARRAYACGIISERSFWKAAAKWAEMVASYYSSWAEYAVSCLCGAVYFMLERGNDLPELTEFFDIQRRGAGYLFEGNQPVWFQYKWYTYPGEKFALTEADILPMLKNWSGPAGCVAAKSITFNGCNIEYMYREAPESDFPDSGWRFFDRDESEYIDDLRNSGVFDLNLLCNHAPDIIPLLESECGAAYKRDENGVFRETHKLL